jgi:hypothetical protein
MKLLCKRAAFPRRAFARAPVSVGMDLCRRGLMSFIALLMGIVARAAVLY